MLLFLFFSFLQSTSNTHTERERSNNRSLSMSDTESQYQSPLRSDSPLPSDDLDPPHGKSPLKTIAAVDKFFSPSRSPNNHHQNHKKIPETNSDFLSQQRTEKSPKSLVVYNQSVREEAAAGVTKVGPTGGGDDLEDGVGGDRRSRTAVTAILRRSKRQETLKRAELGFRVCEMVLCLISFSVMAADKTPGWSGDSFDRYKEYRYCVAVSVIGFVYSVCQACDLSYHLATGKQLCFHPLLCHFDFAITQILSYLLISSSSSAATRVDDWVSNWGKDEFTEKATVSIVMSFWAFLAFSLSSLISGYNLCNTTTT